MDDDLIALLVEQDDEFEEVACCVGSEHQPAIWIFAKVFDCHRVLDGMEHVFHSDVVTVRRVVNLHTE